MSGEIFRDPSRIPSCPEFFFYLQSSVGLNHQHLFTLGPIQTIPPTNRPNQTINSKQRRKRETQPHLPPHPSRNVVSSLGWKLRNIWPLSPITTLGHLETFLPRLLGKIWNIFFLKVIFLCVPSFYLFISGCTGSSLLSKGSSCGKQRLLSGCGAQALHCGGFSCGSWAQ